MHGGGSPSNTTRNVIKKSKTVGNRDLSVIKNNTQAVEELRKINISKLETEIEP
jgi:hypothetical protein